LPCTVLSITFQDETSEKTKQVLEQSSFAVVIASDFKQLEEVCARGDFHVALVESAIQPKVKKAIGRLLNANCPQVPVVEMCHGDPEIAGALPVAFDQLGEIVPAIRRTVNQANLEQPKLKSA
jgi:hypothetical protein